ncbi:hypothetical protein FX985_06442 [Pseudomonas extremaustralis]|uniref:Uncharacterized protein n=1 Tax=Pseudomonas extremaustralis TaxID=359110 RepID=A0A5M9IM74_9PSED|nr:hypothetical protein FX985_06442 [Pseudomonas extremaustralis]
MRVRQFPFEKQLLERQQRRQPLHRALVDHVGGLQLRHARQAAHGLMLEQGLGAEVDTFGTGAADHLDRDDRVAAAFEEIVVQADVLDPEYLRPDRGDPLFQRTLRGFVRLRGFGFWQGLAVQLAIRAERHLLQSQPLGRDHVVRQMAGQVGAQDLTPILLGALQHQVANQVFAVDR